MSRVLVLMCDDEPDIRHLYRLAFEREGADVVEAVDGEDCIAKAAEFQPDLVVLDLFMPNRDGMSALPEVKRTCPTARVLVVSAHGTADLFAKTKARGATACFEKPSFLARIPRLVERYSQPA